MISDTRLAPDEKRVESFLRHPSRRPHASQSDLLVLLFADGQHGVGEARTF
jgi:hypothetical protein